MNWPVKLLLQFVSLFTFKFNKTKPNFAAIILTNNIA